MKRHTGEDEVKCVLCEKVIKGKSNLTIHMKTHTNAMNMKASVMCVKR